MSDEKLNSKTKDKLQTDMDKLFQELTGKINKPRYSWKKFSKEEILANKEKKWTKQNFKKDKYMV